MKRVDIEKGVIDIIAQSNGLKFRPRVNDSFKKLGMDSLDLIETIMSVENEFKINIDDSEYVACSYVRDIVDFVDLKHGLPV